MPAHIWNCTSDFEYCTSAGCKVSNGTIVLKDATTGTVLSDIRDSSYRISDYSEIIPKIDVPAGTSAVFYIRSGWYEEYVKDAWTDWVQVNEATTRMEYTIALTSSKIIADYDIGLLKNIYYRNDYRFLPLASSLKSIYLKGVDPNIPYANELYSILWSGKINEAIVGFAKVGHDSTAKTIYAQDSSTYGNVITLKNTLPSNNVGLIIEYIPRNYIYSENRNRYFQWKLELTAEDTSVTPIVRSVVAKYRLDFQEELSNEFPGLFRRL